MKKLLVAAPMLILASALLAPSCTTGDQGGVTGVGGSGTGPHVGTGGSAQGTGGATQGTGGTIVGTGGTVDAGGDVRPMGTGGAGVGGMIDAGGDMGGGGGIADVAKVLDGFMLLGPCIRDTAASVCATVNGACPGANTAGSGLAGVLTTDKTVTLGGTPGTMYSITLHIQGEVESKQYGGMDANAVLASPAANGFCVGGTPTNADAYNVYLIKVTSGGVVTNYFLNSLQAPGVSNHTTYGIDYTAVIKAAGGSTVRLLAADSNCSMIKNCGPIQNDGTVCNGPIVLGNIEPTARTLNPTFNFTTAYNGQWIVMTVKGVTSP